MRNSINKTAIIILAILIPLAAGTAFYMSAGNRVANAISEVDHSQWTVHIEDAALDSGKLSILTEQLYKEVRSNRDTAALEPVIMKINKELSRTEGPSPQILTDLLRDLSVEHTDEHIRLIAYTTMIIALETEYDPFKTESDFVLSE